MNKTAIYHFSGKVPLSWLNNYLPAYSCILLIQEAEVVNRGVLEAVTRGAERCSKFTGKHICRSPHFQKSCRLATLLKRGLRHRSFFINFARFSRMLFIEHLQATASEGNMMTKKNEKQSSGEKKKKRCS